MREEKKRSGKVSRISREYVVRVREHMLRARHSRVLRGVIFTLIGGALWGINGTVAQHLMAYYRVEPLWLVCIRELTCCWFFFAAAVLNKRYSMRTSLSQPKELLRMAAYGLVAILATQIAYLESIRATNSATATVLQCLNIVLVLAIVCIRQKRRPRRREELGILCALMGTLVLATGGDITSLHLPALGLIWGAINALTVAGMSILPVRLMRDHGNFFVNGMGFLVSGVALTLLYQPWLHMPALDSLGWAFVTFSCVLGTFGAYALYMQGVADAGSVRASLLGTVEPCVATLTTVFWLGSAFTLSDFIGFCLMITMVVLTTTPDNS